MNADPVNEKTVADTHPVLTRRHSLISSKFCEHF